MKMGNIKILLAILKKTHYFKDGNMTIKVCKAHKIDQVKK